MEQGGNARGLADSVGFELLGEALGADTESAIESALAAGAAFEGGDDPLLVFRHALQASIRDIESDPRGELFREFLAKGPYDRDGEVASDLAKPRVSDAECASAIRFIHSFMINSFKGAVAELLAARPCLQLLKRLQRDGELPRDARLHLGDSVRVRRKGGEGFFKGADQHILIERGQSTNPRLVVAGVIEVKSYVASERRLRRQLQRHLQRAKLGLRVGVIEYPAAAITVGRSRDREAVRVAVVPSDWRLPRSFHFEESDGGRSLHVDPGLPPHGEDETTRISHNEWRIRLKWSREALSQAAHDMTFWYMGEVGDFVYSESVPTGWEEMSAREAGRNSTKMMLYYAILRCRTAREEQRAIALYNSYGFGYALGMNFKNKDGRRDILWFEDLEEILASGKTKDGGTIR